MSRPSLIATQRRLFTVGVVCLCVLAVGCLLGWAAATVFSPPRNVNVPNFATAASKHGTISSAYQLNVTASWMKTPVGINRSAGVVTGAPASGVISAEPNTVVYTVNLRPVVVAVGAIPSFEDLSRGSRGADVSQLQSFLAVVGVLHAAPTGVFDARTEGAVKAWQRKQGVTPDGSVRAGDIVYVPKLPISLIVDAKNVSIGASLSGGETVLYSTEAEPTFELSVSLNQSSSIPTGSKVQISAPGGGSWNAKTDAVTDQTDDSGQTTASISLEPSGPSGICDAQCGLISADGSVTLAARVQVVPPTTGTVVPASAVQSEGSSLFVVDLAGRRHKVQVKATANGESVVTGVNSGERLRVPKQ